MRLKDKIAIVTGAGSGFGEGISKRFAQEGCKILVNDINVEGGERVAQEINAPGARRAFFKADVSKDADWAAMLKFTLDTFGGLTTVVNNAGTTHRNQPMLNVTEEQFDRIYAVNVKSIFHSATHCVPYFRQKGGGVFVNIASTAGVRPRPGLTWYNGSKGAAIMTGRSMAVELAPDRIRVCTINPVAGETALVVRVHGWAGHARDPGQVHRHHPAGTPEQAARHRQRGAVPGLGRGGVHHRGVPGGRRRAVRLGQR